MKVFDGNSLWIFVAQVAYILLLVFTCARILIDTRSVSKTLAWLLAVLYIPLAGIVLYFSIGVNYRKRKIYNKKLEIDTALKAQLKHVLQHNRTQLEALQLSVIESNRKLIHLISGQKTGNNPVLPNSVLRPVQNGEELFPIMLHALSQAQSHIHLEYYIYENDRIGNKIKEALIERAQNGVEVRMIFDGFGSRSLRKSMVDELCSAGVQVFPFHRVRFPFLANRLNYRNHRKIVVIDGKVAFTGGINISDRYINSPETPGYWRDTHLMIQGLSVLSLQRVFLSDWNFCSNENLSISARYFPLDQPLSKHPILAQMVPDGPDSDLPNTLFTINTAIQSSRQEIMMATPYFIPDITLKENLILAALSGVQVKLLIPEKADSRLVSLATRSYFTELLDAGVEIYLYTKGFLHAKTFVIDRKLASIGTANLDLRSFDLNFEVMALIYDQKVAETMANTFYNDLKAAKRINSDEWNLRSPLIRFVERVVRLLSPLM